MTIVEALSVEEKLRILSDAAKYDVACTSSGVDREGQQGSMGSAAACGICHSFAADGRCISLLKVLYSNECIYDCKYCVNRCSNDTLRTSFTPEELCDLTLQFYRRNYIEGLFLSSGIRRNPNQTMEELYQVLYLLRKVHRFRGYIHVKAIPGAAPEWIAMVGTLADRMSTNLELPTAEGLRTLAPNKNRRTILTPMRQIQQGIALAKRGAFELLETALPIREGEKRIGQEAEKPASGKAVSGLDGWGIDVLPANSGKEIVTGRDESALLTPARRLRHTQTAFVPAGQSTQMIIGATPENDYEILSVAQALYRKFELKRVFYSAYVARNEDAALPAVGTRPPLLREHRLYQADWLLRYYGFEAQELLSEKRPNFNIYLDPKCEWALRHLEYFPVEVNRASYDMLLRVPGIGVKSARRIVAARRSANLDFENLKRIGVVLKRAHYFITCKGRMLYRTPIDEDYITRRIIELDRKRNWQIEADVTFRQLSLFTDYHLEGGVAADDRVCV